MLGAFIPYVVPPEKTIEFGRDIPLLGDHLTIGVFGILVVIGVLAGIQAAIRVYSKAKDLDEWYFRDQIFWVLVFGFIISHWVSVLFYFPEKVQENPWILLMLWNGLSSVGGFFGAFIGMNWFLRREKQPILVYADGNMYGLLLGMVFGRLSCAWVHDHPGKIVPADTFMAVGPWPCRWRPKKGVPSNSRVSASGSSEDGPRRHRPPAQELGAGERLPLGIVEPVLEGMRSRQSVYHQG
ncbi:MAG: prolipoprotein diacylglyceryl transferase, partial [Deltaproteobacteria bacterium]|nr:prolipoprotein diacylglyceryl transferase [Deltaproteobacteria bacterium]